MPKGTHKKKRSFDDHLQYIMSRDPTLKQRAAKLSCKKWEYPDNKWLIEIDVSHCINQSDGFEIGVDATCLEVFVRVEKRFVDFLESQGNEEESFERLEKTLKRYSEIRYPPCEGKSHSTKRHKYIGDKWLTYISVHVPTSALIQEGTPATEGALSFYKWRNDFCKGKLFFIPPLPPGPDLGDSFPFFKEDWKNIGRLAIEEWLDSLELKMPPQEQDEHVLGMWYMSGSRIPNAFEFQYGVEEPERRAFRTWVLVDVHPNVANAHDEFS